MATVIVFMITDVELVKCRESVIELYVERIYVSLGQSFSAKRRLMSTYSLFSVQQR